MLKSLLIWSLSFFMTIAMVAATDVYTAPKKRKPKLSDLQVPKNLDSKVDKIPTHRYPASAPLIDSSSSVKPFMVGICRGPFGRFYSPQHPEYEACLNNEAPFNENGPFGGKGLGLGLTIDPL